MCVSVFKCKRMTHDGSKRMEKERLNFNHNSNTNTYTEITFTFTKQQVFHSVSMWKSESVNKEIVTDVEVSLSSVLDATKFSILLVLVFFVPVAPAFFNFTSYWFLLPLQCFLLYLLLSHISFAAFVRQFQRIGQRNHCPNCQYWLWHHWHFLLPRWHLHPQRWWMWCC